MTPTEFVEELKASGLTFSLTLIGTIRTSGGICPIQALALHKKLDAPTWRRAAVELDLDLPATEAILSAADDRNWEWNASSLRKALLALCR